MNASLDVAPIFSADHIVLIGQVVTKLQDHQRIFYRVFSYQSVIVVAQVSSQIAKILSYLTVKPFFSQKYRNLYSKEIIEIDLEIEIDVKQDLQERRRHG